MNPTSQRVLKLDPSRTRDLVVDRDPRVRIADGVELQADRLAPATLRSVRARSGCGG